MRCSVSLSDVFLRSAWTGVGRALFAWAADDLRARDYRAITLWVLTTNTCARCFYEMAGWHPDGTTKTEDLNGLALSEVRYRLTV
jgi:GNAT superfamily N-acetyltransferase